MYFGSFKLYNQVFAPYSVCYTHCLVCVSTTLLLLIVVLQFSKQVDCNYKKVKTWEIIHVVLHSAFKDTVCHSGTEVIYLKRSMHQHHFNIWDLGQSSESTNVPQLGFRLVSFGSSSPAWALLWFLNHSFIFFIIFFSFHFSCCFAWHLASHTQRPILPNNPVPSPRPLPSHTRPRLPSHRDTRLLSRQRPLIDEEHGRCSPVARQTPPIWPPTWQRTGTGAQCRYTPLTWSTSRPPCPLPPPPSMESDLSHRT